MPTAQRKKIGMSILIPFALVALVFGVLTWKKTQDSREVRPVPDVNDPTSVRKAVLFFVEDGMRLVREARELEACSDTTGCVKDLLDELFSGPVGDLDQAFPENAQVNDVRLEGDLVIVDLNHSFSADLPAGSSAEMMAVYSLVDTICINFPQFTRVKLTIDGNPNSVLKHLDLSDPLTPDYTLEQTAVPQVTPPLSKQSVQKGKP